MNGKVVFRARAVKFALVVVVLLVLGTGGAMSNVLARPFHVQQAVEFQSQYSSALVATTGYSFKVVASLGDPAPGGGIFINDFEPWGFNNDGEASFAADLDTGGEGGFLASKGQIISVLRTGDPAPGGGVVGPGILGNQALNAQGDAVGGWLGDPVLSPLGLNAAVYRYSHTTGAVTTLMVPGMPAPGGATFEGAFFRPSLNNRGDVAFPGIISPTLGIDGNPLGVGIFLADKAGHISNVASPGDAVPEGTLDAAVNAWINDSGDVAFSGHVSNEECIPVWGVPPDTVACSESIYLKRAGTGQTVSIAHQGAPIPPEAGGGTYQYAWGAAVNNRDDVLFIGDLSTPPGMCQSNGVFLWSGGKTYKVARPGDAMPGGGHMVIATCSTMDYSLNNAGDVGFNIVLDTTTSGVADTGVYIRSGDSVGLVARTGTVIPGLGTIATVKPPFGAGGALLNERGQVLFQAALTDGTQRLLLATPGH